MSCMCHGLCESQSADDRYSLEMGKRKKYIYRLDLDIINRLGYDLVPFRCSIASTITQ